MKMKKFEIFSIPILLFLFLYSCSNQRGSNARINKDIIFQTSTISALNGGDYEGDMTIKELKKYGDFGLGTFNGLDGEMIEVDGKVYQIKADGVSNLVEDSVKTPFSTVTFFDPDRRININKATGCEQLETIIDKFLPTKNIFFAIKIDGSFNFVKTRSVPKQNKPFPALVEVLKKETISEFNNVKGTMVGFRFPSYMREINEPGYHFHFITEDRKFGGHLLECKSKKATVDVDYSYDLFLNLPNTSEFYGFENYNSQ